MEHSPLLHIDFWKSESSKGEDSIYLQNWRIYGYLYFKTEMDFAGLILSHSLLILQINSNTIFEDVQMTLKWFYHFPYGFRFSRLVWECSVYIYSCPWLSRCIKWQATARVPSPVLWERSENLKSNFSWSSIAQKATKIFQASNIGQIRSKTSQIILKIVFPYLIIL